jgi:hypothetical protein
MLRMMKVEIVVVTCDFVWYLKVMNFLEKEHRSIEGLKWILWKKQQRMMLLAERIRVSTTFLVTYAYVLLGFG